MGETRPAALQHADRLGIALVAAGRLQAALLRDWIAGTGLDPIGFRLLAELIAVGPMTMRELADHVGRDPSTVSRQIARLEGRFIQQSADPRDRRHRLVTLTDHGRDTFETVRTRRSENLAAILAAWPAGEVTALIELLERLTAGHLLDFGPLPSRSPLPGTHIS